MPRKKSGNFDQKKYNNDYNKQTYRTISFQIRKDDNSGILEWLDKHPHKKEYLVSLIKEDMKKNQNNC